MPLWRSPDGAYSCELTAIIPRRIIPLYPENVTPLQDRGKESDITAATSMPHRTRAAVVEYRAMQILHATCTFHRVCVIYLYPTGEA